MIHRFYHSMETNQHVMLEIAGCGKILFLMPFGKVLDNDDMENCFLSNKHNRIVKALECLEQLNDTNAYSNKNCKYTTCLSSLLSLWN